MLGTTLSHFKITAKLGEGGMGEVYRAQDTQLGREVAVKVLPEAVASDPERLARFEREARTLATVDHPNIVHIYSVDSAVVNERPIRFLTMQLVEGKQLGNLIPPGGMPLEQLFEIAVPLADALAAAHEAGVVHRDLKPANIMVSDEGRVKVLDFGLAKLQHEASGPEATQLPTEPMTEEGKVFGTAPYMSPEQLEGKELDLRTDIFSLGVIFYEMATGRRPFLGDSSASLISSIMKDTPRDADSVRTDLPHHLGRILRRCLEKDPRRRYQSALDVHNELRDLERELVAAQLSGAVAQESDTIKTVSPRVSKRSQLGLWAAAAAAILLGAALTFWLARDPDTHPTAETAPNTVEAEVPSIAVLPFADLSPDQDQQYFSDGLSEELLSLLARTEGLKAAARTSSFSFRGKEVEVTTIAEKLGVANILEGSVRKSGNQVRITAQLINAADGFHLWSDTYDRELDDIFKVQDEIARSVVEALQVTLLGDAIEVPPSRSRNVEAYNLYLQGKFFAQRRSRREDYEKAIEYLERAVALDPEYALAWAGLAYALHNRTVDGYADYETGHARAVEAVEKALELDENLAEGWAVLGEIRTELEWDWAGAREALGRARELDPENPGVIRRQAELAMSMGDLDLAIALSRQAAELDPLNYLPLTVLIAANLHAGRLDEAEVAAEKLLELNPDYPFGPAYLAAIELARSRPEVALEYAERLADPGSRLYYRALAYHAIGRTREAKELFRDYIEGYGARTVSIAEVYAVMGEADQAFEWLERAYDQRDPLLDHVGVRLRLANLRGDPRWEELLERMNMTP